MKIYEPSSSENSELCHPLNLDEFETIDVLINGTPRLEDWKPIPMEIIREDGGRKFFESDSPWLGGHSLIFRRPLGVNAISATHAEADAFAHAARDGVKGGSGTLYVDRALCPSCGTFGGVRSMARQLGLESLDVVTPGGTFTITP